jgi:hypothetical protein
LGYVSWTQFIYPITSIISVTAMVFVAVGVARIAKVLESMNITTMDVAEIAKRIEKARQMGK